MVAETYRFRTEGLGRAERFVVLGLGRSGMAAARLLRSAGRRVVGMDDKLPGLTEQAAELAAIGGTAHAPDAALAAEADALILSPGVPATHALVAAARRAGIPVIGELELACRFLDVPAIAVTGTNGKSTVVSLVSHILGYAGVAHRLAGNIGNALCGEVEQLTGNERFLVLEVSSFQLETTDLFRPAIACVLNIAPDHLNRYTSLEEYTAAKWRIAMRQTPDDALLVGADLYSSVPDWARAQRLAFCEQPCGLPGISCEGEELVWRAGGEEERASLPAAAAKRRGHQRANGMAAAAIARLAGVPLEVSLQAWCTYEELPHRLEPVRRHNGVVYINDSKATNVHATCAALAAIDDPIVLIAGGSDKGESYGAIQSVALERVVGLVLMGQTADALARDLDLPVPTVRAGSMREAVEAAAGLAQPGDVVLLSPAAASFDMFANFEDRGRRFREEVERL